MGLTDGWTDGRRDGGTDTSSYKDTWTYLKEFSWGRGTFHTKAPMRQSQFRHPPLSTVSCLSLWSFTFPHLTFIQIVGSSIQLQPFLPNWLSQVFGRKSVKLWPILTGQCSFALPFVRPIVTFSQKTGRYIVRSLRSCICPCFTLSICVFIIVI